MLDGDWDTCVAMARDQVKEGSHLIDVCVDYTGADGVADMTEVASRFCTQSSVPLMVDSTEGPVVRAALEWLGGRPILNSVNLEEGDEPGTRLDTFLRLAREFGAAVVCTCIDEEGQARTARVEAARRPQHPRHRRRALRPRARGPALRPARPAAVDGHGGEPARRRSRPSRGSGASRRSCPACPPSSACPTSPSASTRPPARSSTRSSCTSASRPGSTRPSCTRPRSCRSRASTSGPRRSASTWSTTAARDDYDPLQELLALFEGVKVDAGAADDHLRLAGRPPPVSQRIIDGNRNGLEGDLTEALESGWRRSASSTTSCWPA